MPCPTAPLGPASSRPAPLPAPLSRVLVTSPALAPDPDDAEVPSHLGAFGAAFYAEVATGFALSLPEEAALLQVAETLDVLAAVDAGIRETGPTVNGRPSPLIIEARPQRAILVRLLGLLDLPRDDATSLPSGLSPFRAASRAAAARWRQAREEGRFRG